MKPSVRREIIEWARLIVLAVLISLVIRVGVVESRRVLSVSMIPTLAPGDYFLVEKITTRFGEIKRGDIVLLEPPASTAFPDPLVKRVMALAGDTVEVKSGRVLVNGQPASVPAGASLPRTDFGPVTVSAGHIFVMGDNRAESTDSREFGPVRTSTILGRAIARYWPVSKIGLLH